MLEDREEETRNFIGGTLIISISVIFVKIIGVIYKVPLSYILNEEGMSYFNSAYTVYGFFYVLCSSGVPKAISIIISRERCKDRKEGMEIYKIAVRFFFYIGVILSAIFIFMSKPMSYLIGSQNSYHAMLAIAPSLLFVSPSGVMRGYLNSKSKLKVIAVANLFEALIKLGVGLILAYYAKRVYLPLPSIAALSILGITLGCLISCLYMYFNIKNDIKREKTGQKYKDRRKVVREIRDIAFPITLSSSVISISSVFDLGIIMRRLQNCGLDESSASKIYGNYTTLAIPMLNMVVAVVAQITLAILPRLVKSYTRGCKEEYERVLSGALRVTSFITSPCAVAFALYSFDILDILFSSQMSANGAAMLSALSLATVLLPVLTVLNTALESVGKFFYSFISLSASTFIKLLLNYILISENKMGITGAPIATVISYFFGVLISCYLLNLSGIKLKFLRTPAIYVLNSVIAFYFPYYFIYATGIIKNYFLRFAFSGMISVTIYIIICAVEIKVKKTYKIKKINCKNAQI